MDLDRKSIVKAYICLAFSLSFMMTVFAPLELFLTNASEFWFDVLNMLPVIVVEFLILFVSLFVIETILMHIFSKVSFLFDFQLALLFALFLALYIQGNYIPRNYGVLDGTIPDWSQYPGTGIASYVVWIGVLVTSCLLVLFLRKKRGLYFSIIKYVSLAIFAMIFVALLSVVPAASKYIVKPKVNLVTDEKMFEMSSKENIVVFILDTMDAQVMKDALSQNVVDEEELDGFTFYENTAGGYGFTDPSMPLILTGEWYENNMTRREFVDVNFDKTPLFDSLNNADYSVGLYTYGEYIKVKEGIADNVRIGRCVVRDYKQFAKCLYQTVMFQYMPQQIKGRYLLDTNYFYQLQGIAGEKSADRKVFDFSNRSFYEKLLEDGITVVDEKNAFRLIHVTGIHNPWNFNEEFVEDGKEHDYDEAVRYVTKLMMTYIDALKEAGVYDNTSIVICGDHGFYASEFAAPNRCNPTLLVKPAGSKGRMVISDNAFSFGDMNEALDKLVYGEDMFSVPRDTNMPRRYMIKLGETRTDDYFADLEESYIYGNLADGSAYFESTGNVYVEP